MQEYASRTLRCVMATEKGEKGQIYTIKNIFNVFVGWQNSKKCESAECL